MPPSTVLEKFAVWEQGFLANAPVSLEDLCVGDTSLLTDIKLEIERRYGPDIARDAGSDTKTRSRPAEATLPQVYTHRTQVHTPIPNALGKYLIRRKLGSGGMGDVYAAFDPDLNREVALKVMKQDLASRPVAKARFLREARAAAALQHDHVILIHHVGEDHGIPYIVMPLLSGEPLDAWLARDKVLTPDQVVKLAREAALGLGAAHAIGLIHRDIKPSNLWIETTSSGWRVKVIDFGLAKAADGELEDKLSTDGAIVGTPRYMSPEQADGIELTPASDFFSLGAVLYEATTGIRAFPGETLTAILKSIAVYQPEPPHITVTNTPRALSVMIMQLLEKNMSIRLGHIPQIVKQLTHIDARKEIILTEHSDYRDKNINFENQKYITKSSTCDSEDPKFNNKNVPIDCDDKSTESWVNNIQPTKKRPMKRSLHFRLSLFTIASIFLLLFITFFLNQNQANLTPVSKGADKKKNVLLPEIIDRKDSESFHLLTSDELEKLSDYNVKPDEYPDAISFLLDGSGSMRDPWGQKGPAKSKAMVNALSKFSFDVPDNTAISIRVFNNNLSYEDANSVQLFSSSESKERFFDFVSGPNSLLAMLNKMALPTGASPITKTMQQAKNDLPKAAKRKALFVISDGADTSFFSACFESVAFDAKEIERRPEAKAKLVELTRKELNNAERDDVSIHFIMLEASDYERALFYEMFNVVDRFKTRGSVSILNDPDHIYGALKMAMNKSALAFRR